MKRIAPARCVFRAIVFFSVCVMHGAVGAEPPKPPGSVIELCERLDAHIGQPRFADALWSVKIASLATGRTVFEHHATRLMSPASNSKLYTGALALDRLGGDYRIVTPIFAAAAPDATGVVQGDVIVSGRGDPSWGAGTTRADYAKVFEPFVAVLVKAGVKKIAGDLVADATFFRGLPNGAGWTADDLNDYYGAEISALSLFDNYVEFRVTPVTVGAPCEITWLQPLPAGLVLDNRTVAIASGGMRRIEVRRIFGENTVYVFGEAPLRKAGDPVVELPVEEATVPRPANWFAGALKAALISRGIVVAGAARGVRWPEASPVREGAVKLGEIASPPLRELVAGFMKPSQNLETDLIFAHAGEATRSADTPAWRTSEDLGVAVLRDFLRKNALPANEVHFEEGSGLSRNNLTTANATVALLTFMAKHRHADDFVASLPIAGVDGTLRRRMKGTPAEGNVRAKTGSLRYAYALSGFVTTAAGERLVFSLMLNRQGPQPANRGVREELDDIAVMLAGLNERTKTEAGASAAATTR